MSMDNADVEYEAKRQDAIAAELVKMSLAKFTAASEVTKRGRFYIVKVRHTVGFGGSVEYRVRGARSKSEAIRVAHVNRP
ncbi:MAG TPA: hypothetical protein VK176_11665 [Phycisphaerales bacterium]|nr:hypothetical protein [Phycisphaerales bacterium]